MGSRNRASFTRVAQVRCFHHPRLSNEPTAGSRSTYEWRSRRVQKSTTCTNLVGSFECLAHSGSDSDSDDDAGSSDDEGSGNDEQAKANRDSRASWQEEGLGAPPAEESPPAQVGSTVRVHAQREKEGVVSVHAKGQTRCS